MQQKTIGRSLNYPRPWGLSSMISKDPFRNFGLAERPIGGTGFRHSISAAVLITGASFGPSVFERLEAFKF